jgi:hypothetical protein
MTVLVALLAWRAGCALADVAAELDDNGTGRLLRAGLLQAVVFAAVCASAAAVVRLGTSHASVAGAGVAALVLFVAAGGTAFVRHSELGARAGELLPEWVGTAARGAAAGLLVYAASGAVLVAGSLVLHRGEVETLSHHVGGGWSGVPILLLGVLSAPNAVVAGVAYLSGPGFAVGAGLAVSLGAGAHGTLPEFPVLAALPAGHANSATWLLAAFAPIAAGLYVARAAGAAGSLLGQLRNVGTAALIAAVLGSTLAWLGGGGIGTGRLHVLGASPWQFGLALAAALALVGGVAVCAFAGLAWARGRGAESAELVAVVDEPIDDCEYDKADVDDSEDADGDADDVEGDGVLHRVS